MSVLACGRRGCRNIMCDRLILEGGDYICNDCFRELERFQATWDMNEMHVRDVRRRIEEFMSTEPGTYTDPDEMGRAAVEKEFRRLTRTNEES